MAGGPAAAEPLLTPSEAAALLGVDPQTLSRWAHAGRLAAVRTPGGHRRYLEHDVRLLSSNGPFSASR
jgi:excisionase family DNA binding protein